MRKYWNFTKGVLMLLLLLFLYAFTSHQSNARPLASLNIDFVEENTLFISKENLDKMLIQNNTYVQCVARDVLDLKALESKISTHSMIEKAEVYIDIKGNLSIEVEQRKPLARVVSNPQFYIDQKGKIMPLSAEFTARVLLVHGLVQESNLESVYTLLKAVDSDSFLKLYTTDVIVDGKGEISMRLRDCSFEILIGDLRNLHQKIANFKAFYQKSKKEKTLENYKTVNLKFDQQVVGIK